MNEDEDIPSKPLKMTPKLLEKILVELTFCHLNFHVQMNRIMTTI